MTGGPCCAHLHVAYTRREHPGGTCSDAWTCTDCGQGFAPVAMMHADPDREANENAARALYETWSDLPGYVPWVVGGNSHQQDEARRQVRASKVSP